MKINLYFSYKSVASKMYAGANCSYEREVWNLMLLTRATFLNEDAIY